jgi:hypothetical protein
MAAAVNTKPAFSEASYDTWQEFDEGELDIPNAQLSKPLQDELNYSKKLGREDVDDDPAVLADQVAMYGAMRALKAARDTTGDGHDLHVDTSLATAHEFMETNYFGSEGVWMVHEARCLGYYTAGLSLARTAEAAAVHWRRQVGGSVDWSALNRQARKFADCNPGLRRQLDLFLPLIGERAGEVDIFRTMANIALLQAVSYKRYLATKQSQELADDFLFRQQTANFQRQLLPAPKE